MLSCDLVHVVSSPLLAPVKMLNEDAYMGLVLLPFNISRITTKLIYPHGVVGFCIDPSVAGVVHYVKEGDKYGCMRDMHLNVTTGEQICRTKFCNMPKSLCKYAHPSSAGTCRVSQSPKWKVISPKKSCERNSEGIVRKSYAQVMNKNCCLKLCEETCWCVAVDYYVESVWCNLYDKPCKRPSQSTGGQPSSMLFVSRTTGEEPGGVSYPNTAMSSVAGAISTTVAGSNTAPSCGPNTFARNLTGVACKGLHHKGPGDGSQALCRAACCADLKKCGLYQWSDPALPGGGVLAWLDEQLHVVGGCRRKHHPKKEPKRTTALGWRGRSAARTYDPSRSNRGSGLGQIQMSWIHSW